MYYEAMEQMRGRVSERTRDDILAELDPATAKDFLFVADFAEAARESGGLALIVGGFARDEVISQVYGTRIESKDIDVEVYGIEFEDVCDMLAVHNQVDRVGASFGIAKVINPVTGSVLDFSIPRRDSKVDKGHKGFVVTGDPSMSVAEAARRRDLTINALALDPLSGEIIDDYGGDADIRAGILRATDMDLFGDDPLRVLRLMQFAGRFGFAIDPATADLARELDLTELADARIGEEWVKLMTKAEYPSVGLQVAKELGILAQLHPELDVLSTVPQEPEWHPEGDVWVHTKHVADAAARIVREEGLTGEDAKVVLFGALCHDLGKANTTEYQEKKGVMRWTAHGHELASVEPARKFLEQLQLGAPLINKVLPIIREHLFHAHNPDPTDKQLNRFAGRLQPASIYLWNLVSRADANGRGEAFQARTASHNIYQRSLAIAVHEKPLPRIVEGRDLIAHIGLKPGPSFTPILEWLYDAQLDGVFGEIAEGIAYYQAHCREVEPLIEAYITERSKPKPAA